MPELKWDELDFLMCLEVVPETEEYGTEFIYEVKGGGLRLIVTVWPFESVAQFTLWQDLYEAPLLDFALFVRGEVRYISDKGAEYLEFQDSVFGPGRFWYSVAGDPFSHEQYAVGISLKVRIKPIISLRFE